MALELRILSGARAGTVLRFDNKVEVAIGRHAMSDLRFDPHGDLDVSTRHAELRLADTSWMIADCASTNGTFVNGQRLMSGERKLVDGDVVSFGANGPQVEVHGVGGSPAPATALRPSAAPTPTPVSVPRLDTGVRVKHEVQKQTKSMRRTFVGTVATLIAAGAIGLIFWQRQNTARDKVYLALIAQGESSKVALEKQLAAIGPVDSALKAQLQAQLSTSQRNIDAARAMAAGRGTGSVDLLSQQMARTQMLTQVDVPKIREANDAAVAMIAADFDGKFIAGTAFGVSTSGMLITNRHVVRTRGGVDAGRLLVIFANTNKWLPARIVRVAEGEDDDLALLQVEVAGKYPSVTGVSRAGALARVGAAVMTIGYPGANETPMEGSGMNITARTTTTSAMVSKRLDNVIQLDGSSGHGASGSPLFDAGGNVVGVIYGGALESGGRIVYAVPAQRLSAFLGVEGAGVVR